MKPKKPGKKAQFYIFTAIVLVAFAFSVSRTQPLSSEKPDVFSELHSNFLSESNVVVNNAIYESANVSSRFQSFADSYLQYARSREPGFRLAYILKDDGALVVRNKLGITINATIGSSNYQIASEQTVTTAPGDVTLHINNINYAFSTSGQAYQIGALFRQASGNEVRIYKS